MYVSLVVQAYNHFNQPPLTATDTDHLQLACLFYVTGRENEAAFGQDGYLRYRQKSADAFEKYIRKNLPQQFTEQEIQFYKQGIYDSYSTSPPHYVILRICHDLDLLRCYPQSEYDKKTQSAKNISALLQNLSPSLPKSASGKQAIESWANKPTTVLFSRSIEEVSKPPFKKFKKFINQGAFM